MNVHRLLHYIMNGEQHFPHYDVRSAPINTKAKAIRCGSGRNVCSPFVITAATGFKVRKSLFTAAVYPVGRLFKA